MDAIVGQKIMTHPWIRIAMCICAGAEEGDD
jgi:hypothetical protein